ncbi:hypothetical protein NP493_2314g00004 [Ridgeia piscesae]|uniref:Uncharacterized protein n=1 Tax=Ridgeia piscesae TaxID=27915 RepID=A0AAD9JI39_RIDPI|nr:hypothetical protein NP493_2314g00004 [Ridgeia piscesae]
MAALSIRVIPCLSLCSSRLSSGSNAENASAPYRWVDSTIARYILSLTCMDTWW